MEGWTFAAKAAAPLIRTWSHAWNIPPSYALAICEIESSFRTNAHNGAATSQGGAWGLMQITWTTARDLVKLLENVYGAAIGPAHHAVIAKSFIPTDPSCLFDPELNVMLGTLYLSRFALAFGRDISKIAAAYHNGGGFLREFLAAGKQFPQDLPPKASIYVHCAALAQRKYQTEDGSLVS